MSTLQPPHHRVHSVPNQENHGHRNTDYHYEIRLRLPSGACQKSEFISTMAKQKISETRRAWIPAGTHDREDSREIPKWGRFCTSQRWGFRQTRSYTFLYRHRKRGTNCRKSQKIQLHRKYLNIRHIELNRCFFESFYPQPSPWGLAADRAAALHRLQVSNLHAAAPPTKTSTVARVNPGILGLSSSTSFT